MHSLPGGAGAGPTAVEQSTGAEPLPIIWPLLGRHIAFHRRLVDLTDSVKAALLLSQSIYWTRRGRSVARSGGWFHKTAEQWAWETCLSPREQGNARDVLRELSFLEERRLGVPARGYFRLDLDSLGQRLAGRIAADPRCINWHDMVVVAQMLGPAVAYHRTLAGIGGGVHAGLLLSRALYLTRIQSTRELDAWICNSTARWTEELGLSRREQEGARRDLQRIGIWEEARRGVPASLVARVRLEDLLSLLIPGDSADQAGAAYATSPVCGKTTDKLAQNGESRMWQSHMLVSTKAPNKIRQKRQSIYVLSTSVLVQTQHKAREVPVDNLEAGMVDATVTKADSGGGGDLIFPDRMLPQERAAAQMLLRPYVDQSQALLDELAGRLKAQGVRGSPVAYLRGLIARAMAGTFIAELGPAIAAERRNRQQAEGQRAVREAQERREAALRNTPEYQARIRAQREKLSELRDDMKRRLTKSGSR